MAYVVDVFRDKKSELLVTLKEFLDRFHIPTTRKVGGIYTVDLIRELSKELAPVTPIQIDEGLDFLIEKMIEIRGRRRV